MYTFKTVNIRLGVTGVVLTLLTACTEWNSHPVVVEQNFGRAYHNMVKNQTLYPEHGQDDKPVMGMDGRKAQGVINAYRQPASGKLEDAKQAVTIDVGN